MSLDIEAARKYHHEREAQRRTQRERARQYWLERTRDAIRRLAPRYPQVQRVYLFGSLTQPGRFQRHSDLDVAVVCETLTAESAFWRALEQDLRRDVDVRPLTGAVADAVAQGGALVYER
jgi:predicted nucleotidyltransferase